MSISLDNTHLNDFVCLKWAQRIRLVNLNRKINKIVQEWNGITHLVTNVDYIIPAAQFMCRLYCNYVVGLDFENWNLCCDRCWHLTLKSWHQIYTIEILQSTKWIQWFLNRTSTFSLFFGVYVLLYWSARMSISKSKSPCVVNRCQFTRSLRTSIPFLHPPNFHDHCISEPILDVGQLHRCD